MIRLLQLTDTHIVADANGCLYGVNTADSLMQVLDHIQQQAFQADALLVTGDLVHDEGEDAYRKLDKMLARLQLPIHYLPGNHDDPAILHRCFPNSPASGLYSFEMNNWLVVMLDSVMPDKVEGYLASATLSSLAALLNRYQGWRVLVAVHHHPVSTGSEWMDRIGITNGDEFLELLKQYQQVKLVINGHIHQVVEKKFGHFTVLGTPSTCAQFKPGTLKAGIDDTPPGYRYLELHEDGHFNTTVFRI